MPTCDIHHEISTILLNLQAKNITINYAKSFVIETGEKFTTVEPEITLQGDSYTAIASLEVTYRGHKVTLEDLITQLTLGQIKRQNAEVSLELPTKLPPTILQEFKKIDRREGAQNEPKT